MTESFFITMAYVTTGILLGWLCFAAWLAARRTKRQLAENASHEA